MRTWALAAVVANVGIVVTGGIVRVTGSGLGCPTWPTCDADRVVPSPGADAGWHQAIEFGNRLLTFVVLVAVVGAWLAARRALPAGDPGRRLASLLPVGVLAQAVLGGVTVLTGLSPLVVASHFLLSMALILVAVALHDRVARPDARAVASDLPRRLAAALVPLGALVLVLGTIVTASGPHAGDPGTPRLGVPFVDVTRLHSLAVWVVVGVTVALLLAARRAGEGRLAGRAGVLLGVELVQGAVGYAQYALGVPPALVATHLLLGSLFWVAVVRCALLAVRDDRGAQPPAARGDRLVPVGR